MTTSKTTRVERGAFLSTLQSLLDSGSPSVAMLNIPLEWIQTPSGKPDPAPDGERRIETAGLTLSFARIGWATYGLVIYDADLDRIGRALLGAESTFPWRLAVCDTGRNKYMAPDLIRALETVANEHAKREKKQNFFVLGRDGAIERTAQVGSEAPGTTPAPLRSARAGAEASKEGGGRAPAKKATQGCPISLHNSVESVPFIGSVPSTSNKGLTLGQQRMVEEIQRVAAKLGVRSLSQSQFDEHHELGGVSTAGYQFGSWNEAVVAAGLEPNSSASAVRQITDRELLEEIIRVHRELGGPPSERRMAVKGRYSVAPYRDRWGTFSRAKQAAYELLGSPDEE